MNLKRLAETAKLLVADGKGLLAMDESNATCNKRFASLGIAQTEESRRAWRELILTTPQLGNYIGGVILYDETIHQKHQDGRSFIQVIRDAGMIPGIKVDTGLIEMEGHPGEKLTQGLEGLAERLAEYANIGAKFAKWRAVFTIDVGLPSRACIEANAQALASYASLCQEAGLVPIVEPEVLMQGTHTLARCRAVTEQVLREVFTQLYLQGVVLHAVILKPSMVLPGDRCDESAHSASLEDIADATVGCLLQTIPAAIPAITFLSGGQSGDLASSRLNAMNVRFKTRLPWPLSFSFARAIQNPAMEIWAGEASNTAAAQAALLKRAMGNQAASEGLYSSEWMMDTVKVSHNEAVSLITASLQHQAKALKRKKYVFGNWKMNTNEAKAKSLAAAIVQGMPLDHSMQVAVFPPFPYLSVVRDSLGASSIALGAQNLYPASEGAFTGEVSPGMLLDVGCQYVLLGHSERRQLLTETDAFINQKVRLALAAGLSVVLCIGESLQQRETQQTQQVLDAQLIAGLAGVGSVDMQRVIIAYEPLWAIGKQGQQASPKQVQQEQHLIRQRISQMFGQATAESLVVLYGGSVNPDNAAAIFNTPGLDGVLIGADSLDAEQFLAIIQAGVKAL